MRHQAEPRGEVAAAAEGASITDRGDQRGRVQHADARDGGQTASGRIVARHLGELVVQRLDARIEGAPLIEHVVEQTLNARAYLASVWLRRQDDRQRLEQAAAALRDYDPALEQDGADLVRQRGALSDQPVAHAMQNLHVELRLALERHEPHRRPGRRLGGLLLDTPASAVALLRAMGEAGYDVGDLPGVAAG